jgi:feruloyl esterase
MKLVKSIFVAAILALFSVNSTLAESAHINLDELRKVRLPEVSLDNVTHDKSYAQVQGTIGGTIKFELLLPDTWNERFVMGGGGGFVGTVQNSARGSVLQGYATVGTDAGHESPPGISGVWAYTNIEAQVNFGYLAVHRTAETAKALIRMYYGKDAVYSYFSGCSRGGGQAMVESQRFPDDFDGIVSGAPAFNWPGIASLAVTVAQTLYPDPAHLDKPILDRSALEKLQQSIIDQCDEKDGLKDGIVQDPPTAGFDLAKVPGLTDEQRKAIAVISGGSHDDKGMLYPGFSPGAEVDPNQWIAWIVGSAPQLIQQSHAPDLMFAFGTQIFKYLIFNDPDWDYSTYHFTNFEKETRLAASFLNATSADLDRLNARHGKMILWHGWADTALPAQATVDYYRQLQKHDPHCADYCRLFMVPGCLHCGGGPGASEVDWLKVMVNWVEHGQAPEKLIASKRDHGTLVLTRPLFPYPQTAVYKSGDTNKAESFEAKMP